MKRSTEEALMVSRPKRRHTHRGSGQAQMASADAAAAARRPTTADALSFLNDVKEVFNDNKDTFQEVVDLLRDFIRERINSHGVIELVKRLFKGHPTLILRFNLFLPKGIEIKLSEEEEMLVMYQQALTFVEKVKSRFHDNGQVWKAFFASLHMYLKDNNRIQEAYKEMASLFQKHPNLLQELRGILPDALTAMAPMHVPSARVFSRQNERSSAAPAVRRAQGDKNERACNSQIEHEVNPGHPYTKNGWRRKYLENEKDRKEDRDRRENDWNENFDQSAEVFNNVPRRTGGFGYAQFQQGGEGTENFGMDRISASSLNGVYSQECIYLNKLKQILNDEAYREFLKCLNLYSEEIVSRNELNTLVSNIFANNQDLIKGFDKFFTCCDYIDEFLEGVFHKRHLSRSPKEETTQRDKEGDRESERGRERGGNYKNSSFDSKDAACQRVPLHSKKRKNNCWKPISELDLSNCKRCAPSYCLLPKNYSIPPSSHRTELDARVLNDKWVSVTFGSEDYSFKHMRKNRYEESLFRCEDDRFELDMLLESVNSTIKKVEELLESLQDNTIEPENQIPIKEQLTSSNLRCIERLYGDHGLDLLDILSKNNASLAVPIILTRLKQKQEDWSRCRSEFNKVWAEAFAKNYDKLLDHESFDFKQQDTKSLSSKVLLDEIREIDENKQEDVLLAVGAGNMRPCGPSMTFDYEDPDIHEDLYAIVKYSCGEICTSTDQVDHVMGLWTAFLEPMCGIVPNPQRADYSEDWAKSKIHFIKDGMARARESEGFYIAVADKIKSNALSNSEVTAPPKQGSSCNARLADATVVQDGNCVACIDDSLCRTTPHGKEQPSAPGVDEISAVTAKGDCSLIFPVPLVCTTEQGASMDSPKSGNLGLKMLCESPYSSGVLPCSEVLVNARAVTRGNGCFITETSKVDKHKEGSASLDDFAIEREGELSPNGNSEEANLLVFEHMHVRKFPEVKYGSSSMEECLVKAGGVKAAFCGETAGDNDDDEFEESTRKSLEDSDNASVSGADVSGSESADGKDCFHGVYEEEEEDADHDHQDAKVDSESEAERMADGADVGGEIMSLPSDHFLNTVKPLSEYVAAASSGGEDKGSHILYGNDSLYVLFRLHQTLYRRIFSAKRNSSAAERKWISQKNTRPPDLYAKFMGALRDLLDGSSNNRKFEDDCRAIMGAQSYVLFTLDKLIHKIVKQLRSFGSVEMDNKLLQLYLYEQSRHAGRFFDLVYQENARVLLHDERIYRLECFSNPTRLSIQLMEHECENLEATAVCIDSNFSTYFSNEFLSTASIRKNMHGFVLGRIKRKYGSDDEDSANCKAMEGIQLANGLQCKISCSSSRVSYVLGTEDLLYRKRRKRTCMDRDVKVQRFHSFLSRFLHDVH